MADAVTPNIGLDLPARNEYINTWDTPVNGNFSAIDAKIGGSLTIALTNQNVALTQAQAQNANFIFTGATTGPVIVSLPAGFGGLFSVLNGTTNNVPVIFNTAAGGAALYLPQGLRVLVISDGTNVMLANQAIPPGTPIPWLANAIPGGFIQAYGQVLSQTTFSGIFAAYGIQFNTGGEGAGNFRMPDLRGVTLAGLDNMGGTARGLLTAFGSNGQQIGALGGEQTHTLLVAELAQHNHVVVDPQHAHGTTESPHNHPYRQSNTSNTGAGGGPSLANNADAAANTGLATTGLTVNAASTGITLQAAGQSAPHNNIQPTILCNWIIKT